jgi:hypothetical protein
MNAFRCINTGGFEVLLEGMRIPVGQIAEWAQPRWDRRTQDLFA